MVLVLYPSDTSQQYVVVALGTAENELPSPSLVVVPLTYHLYVMDLSESEVAVTDIAAVSPAKIESVSADGVTLNLYTVTVYVIVTLLLYLSDTSHLYVAVSLPVELYVFPPFPILEVELPFIHL